MRVTGASVADQAYANLVRHVLGQGQRKENRTGISALSTFDQNFKHDLSVDGFPLLTTKKMNWKNILVENLWFLRGDPDVAFLHQHECNFWDPWIDKEGRVPSAYGMLWRQPYDQLKYVMSLLEQDPMSRRMVVTAWQPENAHASKLPPCHVLWVLNVQYMPKGPTGRRDKSHEDARKLCLHLTQRSADIGIGVPYNIAGYSFLLELFSHIAGIPPGVFGYTMVDAHLYENHICPIERQIARYPRSAPKLVIDPLIQSLEDVIEVSHDATTEELLALFKIVHYNPHPSIALPVAV